MTQKYDREAMIAEARDLGLEFKGNISNVKLAELIENHFLDTQPIPPNPEDVQEPETPKAAPKPQMSEAEKLEALRISDPVAYNQARQRKRANHLREAVKKAKEKAFKKHIVTITNKDPRENEVMTTVHLTCENQYFGISRIVPLDIPVELEACLIHIAASTTMTQPRDEIDRQGRRTGNKIVSRVKKFAISYSGQVPEE